MTNNLINSAKVKRYALEYIAEHRHYKFSRVSAQFLDRANRHMKAWIKTAVITQPNQGKTLR